MDRLLGGFGRSAAALPSGQDVSAMRVAAWNEVGRRYRSFDTALAAIALIVGQVALFSGGFGEPEPEIRDGDALGVVLVAFATVPLAVRSLWPLPVFLISVGATLALYALEYPGELAIIPIIAVHSLAASAEDPRRARILAVVTAVAYGLIAAISLLVFEPDVGLLSLGVFWGVAWVAGVQTRLRRERIDELEQRAQRAEREAERERQLAAAEERARIARELHDSAGHAINAILLQLEAARVLRDRDPERSEIALDTVERVARETIAEIDGLVGALREEGPADLSPVHGLDALAELLERHRADGLSVNLEVRGEPRRLPPAVDRAGYRIVQEALTNAARHGGRSANVICDFGNGGLDVTISNPIGPRSSTRVGGGHGLTGMRERASLLGGVLDAAADDGVFRVRARLPYRRARL
jgi:signal transduction histidine kinase